MATKKVTSCCRWHKLLHRSITMGLPVAVTTGICRLYQYCFILYYFILPF